MTIIAALSFSIIMLALAALPSASVALVITRAATHGVKDGFAVAGGIVIGDLFFVALVLLGMSILAETMGAYFLVLKYIGGAYLIWLGYSLLQRSEATLDAPEQASGGSSLMVSFLAGLALTLGDLKAILFYASLFPGLFELARLTTTDIAIIAGATILTVGGVKVMYALAAKQIADKISQASASTPVRTIAGAMLMSTGAYLIVRS